VAFACKQGGEDCPEGYECQVLAGQTKRCVRQGLKLDGGKKPDSGKIMDQGPAVDRGPSKDRGQIKDTGQAPDKKPPADLPPKPDASPGGPLVALISPNNNVSLATYSHWWKFKVAPTAGTSISKCTLFVDGKDRGSKASPSTATSGDYIAWTDKSMSAGKHPWYVSCIDSSGKTGVSATWILNHAPIKLTACKRKGFKSYTRYIVSGTLSSKTEICLEIDSRNVLIQGDAKAVLRGTSSKDVVTHKVSSPPTVWKNLGTKGWQLGWQGNVFGEKHLDNMDAHDLTGDGRLDLITSTSGGYIRIYKNLGKGKFQTTPTLFSSSQKMENRRIVDFDRDGYPDMFAAGNGTKEAFYTGKSSGGLSYKIGFSWGFYTRNIDLGHFDSDDQIDVATGSAYSSGSDYQRHVGLKSGTSAGFTKSWNSTLGAGGGHGPTFVGDFDGDGKFDILVPQQSSSAISAMVYFGAGGGKFSGSHTFSGGLPAGVRDLNGDGKTDALVFQATTKRNLSSILSYRLVGKSWVPLNGLYPKYTGGIARAAFHDVTGDGKPDAILLGAGTSDQLLVYRNAFTLTGGTWALVGSGNIKGAGHSLDLRDMDNDGDLDVLASHYLGSGSGQGMHGILYANTGAGLLKPSLVHKDPLKKQMAMAAPGDLDGEPSYGVRINKGIREVGISDLTIRGFAGGIEVLGADAVITAVTVEDPDLFGVRVTDASGTTVTRLSMKNAVRGIGLKVIGSKIKVYQSVLCPSGYHQTRTFIGAECVKSSVTVSSGSGNQASLNNGCGKNFMSSFCR